MSTDLMGKPQAQTPLSNISLIVLGLLIIMLTVGCSAAGSQAAGLVSPPGFQPLAEIDLSARPYDAETLGQFTVEETAVVGVFFSIQDIDTPYFDLSLVGPDGESLAILHSEKYRTDRDGGGLWEQSLPPGAYHVVLTAEQSPGVLSIHWGYR